MKNIYRLTILFCILISISCKTKEDNNEVNNNIPALNTNTNAKPENVDSIFKNINGVKPNPNPATVGNNSVPNQNVTVTPNQPNNFNAGNVPQIVQNAVNPTAAPATTAPGMNPPHGQPGHRCEIAVGAPLNSTPANAAKAVTTNNKTPLPAPLSVTGPQNNVPKTAPGMNPPHGQPLHRCDIAVGAPLDSKPTVPTTLPVVAPEPATPIKKDSLN